MEERATYAAGQQRPVSFRDLRAWLDRLRPDQLDAPALLTSGADEPASHIVVGLVAVGCASEDAGGEFAGPTLLVGEVASPFSGERLPVGVTCNG